MKVNRLSSCVLVLSAALIPAGSSFAQKAGEPPRVARTPAFDSEERVEQSVKAILPTEDERKFDQIGWATDILTAQKLARQHNRPVFLFTHDGRMAPGRC